MRKRYSKSITIDSEAESTLTRSAALVAGHSNRGASSQVSSGGTRGRAPKLRPPSALHV